MLSWASAVLTLLKIVDLIMVYVNREKLMAEGHDKAIADATAEILKKTAAGKAMMEKVNAMSDKEVDDGLRGLEPR